MIPPLLTTTCTVTALPLPSARPCVRCLQVGQRPLVLAAAADTAAVLASRAVGCPMYSNSTRLLRRAQRQLVWGFDESGVPLVSRYDITFERVLCKKSWEVAL